MEGKPKTGQLKGTGRIAFIHREVLVSGTYPLHKIGYFTGPELDRLRRPWSCTEEIPWDGRPDLLDRLYAQRQVMAPVRLEQLDLAFRRHKGVSRGIVQGPHLHVAAAGRIPDVDWVE